MFFLAFSLCVCNVVNNFVNTHFVQNKIDHFVWSPQTFGYNLITLAVKSVGRDLVACVILKPKPLQRYYHK